MEQPIQIVNQLPRSGPSARAKNALVALADGSDEPRGPLQRLGDVESEPDGPMSAEIGERLHLREAAEQTEPADDADSHSQPLHIAGRIRHR